MSVGVIIAIAVAVVTALSCKPQVPESKGEGTPTQSAISFTQ